MNEWLIVLLMLALLWSVMFLIQYKTVIKPAKKRFDIWLSQQDEKNKKGS